MKVVCYEDEHRTNFGDDLNRWLWSRILGFPLNDEDGTLLLGVGTVISRGLIPPAQRYIVMGSGVGYDAVPDSFGGPAWDVLAVRGPLTSEVLGLPPEKAITDSAVLLRLLPEFQPLPESERAGIAFMPHCDSLPSGNWRQVSELAGCDFLDPLAGSEHTVQRIRGAKLVIAGAMHAAIVADALRVPWIPVVLSPDSNTFKWLDWTMSMSLPYRPAVVPASTLLESVRNRALRICGPAFFLEDGTPSQAIARFRRIVRLKSSKYWPLWRRRAMLLTYFIPRRIVTSVIFRGLREQQDEDRTRRAADALRRVAGMPSFLSGERVLDCRLEQLAGLLPKLKP